MIYNPLFNNSCIRPCTISHSHDRCGDVCRTSHEQPCIPATLQGKVSWICKSCVLTHFQVIFLSDTSRALGLLSELYMTLSQYALHTRACHPQPWQILTSKMFQSNIKTSQNDKRRLIKLELETRNALFRLQALIITMKNELGLLPVSV